MKRFIQINNFCVKIFIVRFIVFLIASIVKILRVSLKRLIVNVSVDKVRRLDCLSKICLLKMNDINGC